MPCRIVIPYRNHFLIKFLNRNKMNELEITDVKLEECKNSRFVVPQRVTFKQNGVKKRWDFISTHDDVAILVYNITSKYFLLVKQFRPALYMGTNTRANTDDLSSLVTGGNSTGDVKISAPFDRGVSYELCAGIVDANRPLKEIVRNEVFEELGYDVPESCIEELFDDYTVDYAGTKSTMFYAEVTDQIKVGKGGGNRAEGEIVELYQLPLSEARSFMYNNEISKPSCLIAALSWFFLHKTKLSQNVL